MLSDLFWRYQKSKNLYYRSVVNKGAKGAIIFLHGMGASRNYWAQEYNILSKDHSLYFIDLLGFGFSAKPLNEYTISRHINALGNFIRDEIKEQNVSFIGHSLGAIIALAYVRRYTRNVKRAILLSLPYYHSEKEASKMIKSSRPFSFLYTDTPAAHISCMAVCFLRPVFIMFASLMARKDIPMEIARDVFLHTHTSYFSTLRNIILRQNLPKLIDGEVRGKILLVHGMQDETVQVKNVEELARKYSLELIVIKDESHNFPSTSQAKTVEIIQEYITKL